MNNLFIEPELSILEEQRQNASYLRREFDLHGIVKQAFITLTACGLYKAYINGKEIDNQILLPGFTFYRKRLQYQKYDITNMLNQRQNVIGAVIGDGWYRGSIGLTNKTNFYGTKIKFLCVLDITYEDGTIDQITSDLNWKATQNGPIRKNDLKFGEEYDATLEMPGWNKPGFNDCNWHQVMKSSYDGELVPSEGEKILEHEEFKPKIIQTADGSNVLDFGQNISGYVSFKVNGKKGQKVSLIHGETLDENGNFTLKNVLMEGKNKKRQRIDYTLMDGEQEYKPTFTVHGFQYVKLENWPEEVKAEKFKSLAVYSDLKTTGEFECSNKFINQLVNNVKWSQKSNFLDIPTDCPTRERAGWTGDISVFAETGSYLMDTQLFLKKWLKDVAAQQHEDGRVPNVIPSFGYFDFMDGSAGWADAVVTVPYTLYNFYKNKEVLEKQYDSIVKWVEYQRKRAEKSYIINKLKRGGHRKYIVDTGYHWGEWLEPGHDMLKDIIKNIVKCDSEVATAYFAYSVRLLSEIANILNREADQKEYEELYQNIQIAYCKEFLKDGKVNSNRQCRYVRPVALDLVDENHKKVIVKELNEMVITNNYRIGTGFLTTPFVLKVLSENGYVETAYKMLENTERPGWLYAVTKGSTTIWENWYGKDDKGVPKDSMNHYAPGSVVAWLFSYCVGIRPLEPGFDKILIQPMPGGTLTYAKATFVSRRGTIVSDWKIEDEEFVLHVTIPEGVQAVIKLPSGGEYEIAEGQHEYAEKISYNQIK